MEKVKKFSRELAPHAAWRGIELGWDVVRAALLTVVVTLWQWFQHHWDITMIVIVFVVCAGLLIWRDLSLKRTTNVLSVAKSADDTVIERASTVSKPGNVNIRLTGPNVEEMKAMRQEVIDKEVALRSALQSSSHHESRANIFEKQAEGLKAERDKFSAEVDRLNQHIKELLGNDQTRAADLSSCRSDLQRVTAALASHDSEDASREVLRNLRYRARQIRRTWPLADFNHQPLDIQSWTPRVRAQIPAWFPLATKWKQSVDAIPHIIGQRGLVLRSLTFEDVMELLEEAEAAPLAAEFRPVPPDMPDVRISQWGEQDGSGYLFGWSVYNNIGNAHNVQIYPPIRLGDHSLGSDTIPLLSSEHGQAPLRAWMQRNGGGVIPNTLLDIVRENQETLQNGTKIAPKFRIIYQAQDQTWLASNYQIELSDAGQPSLVFTFINREALVRVTQPTLHELE